MIVFSLTYSYVFWSEFALVCLPIVNRKCCYWCESNNLNKVISVHSKISQLPHVVFDYFCL